MIEQWVNLSGFEETHQGSDIGRIRSKGTNHILKPRLDSLGKYLIIDIRVDGVKKTVLVHRLIAKSFLGLPSAIRNQINHKNGIKTDNTVCNLEWVSQSENMIHSYQTLGRITNKGKIGIMSGKAKMIVQMSNDGDKIAEFYGGLEIERELGFDCSTIHKCCKGQIKQAYGFKWEYQHGRDAAMLVYGY